MVLSTSVCPIKAEEGRKGAPGSGPSKLLRRWSFCFCTHPRMYVCLLYFSLPVPSGRFRFGFVLFFCFLRWCCLVWVGFFFLSMTSYDELTMISSTVVSFRRLKVFVNVNPSSLEKKVHCLNLVQTHILTGNYRCGWAQILGQGVTLLIIPTVLVVEFRCLVTSLPLQFLNP